MTYLCNQLKVLVGDHLGIIPVKFGQNSISGFQGDVYVKMLIVDDRQRPFTIAHPEHCLIR